MSSGRIQDHFFAIKVFLDLEMLEKHERSIEAIKSLHNVSRNYTYVYKDIELVQKQ